MFGLIDAWKVLEFVHEGVGVFLGSQGRWVERGLGDGPDFLAFGFDQNGCGFAEYDGTLGERVWYWLAATSRLRQKGRIGLDGLGRLQRAAGGPKPNVRCCVALIRTG